MIIRKDFNGEPLDVFLTIGFFDGIHLGHRRIIGEVVKKARSSGVRSCVVTFDHHPSELFSGKPVKLLTSWEEKREILSSLGVEIVQVFTFDYSFSTLHPHQFLQKLSNIFNVREILVGEEFTFGYKREGNVEFLSKNQHKFGYRLKIIPSVKLNGEKISSSLLRKWLSEGKIKMVIQGMGRFPTVVGKVIAGRGNGKKIGYPTANLQPHPQKLLPCSGVYAGFTKIEGRIYKTLVNIGGRPTFGDFTPGVEAHIIDFTGELYGRTLSVELIRRIRDIQVFPSSVALSNQLKKDKDVAERILERSGLLEYNKIK